eukprot:scaffold22279_cov123-Isochrysis_galbana.AAC.10
MHGSAGAGATTSTVVGAVASPRRRCEAGRAACARRCSSASRLRSRPLDASSCAMPCGCAAAGREGWPGGTGGGAAQRAACRGD